MSTLKKSIGAILAASVVMAAVRTFLITNNMEKNIYENDTYYLPTNGAVIGFTVFTLLFILFFGVISIMLGRKRRFVSEVKSNSVVVTACVLAFVLVGAAVMYMLSVTDNVIPRTLDILVAVFSILSAAVFVSICIYPDRSKTAFMVLGLFPLLLSIFRLLNDFIGSNAAPLASSGGYHIIGLIVVMLYFLCEGKTYHNAGSAALYLFFGFMSVYFLLVYALPNLILHCFGVFSFDYKSCYSAVDVLLAAYIASRMSLVKIVSK